MSKQEQIRELYFDPVSGYTGKAKLLKQAKQVNPTITMNDINEFFKMNNTTQVFTQKKKAKGKHITGPIGAVQIDLMFYPYPKQNKGYNTILTAVGINHRYGWAIPMKGKSATETNRAITELLKQAKDDNKEILTIESDNGSEFMNKIVQKTFKENNIFHITADEGDHNFQGKIERFNRTIKAMIAKYMSANNTTTWIDVLDKIIKNYNNSEHSAIKEKPKNISIEDEQDIIDNELVKSTKIKTQAIQIGDKVRLPLPKKVFQKEGKKFSDEVFFVDKIFRSKIAVRDEEGNLQKKKYKIDEVLIVPQSSKSINQKEIKKANKEVRVDRRINKEGLSTLSDFTNRGSGREIKNKIINAPPERKSAVKARRKIYG